LAVNGALTPQTRTIPAKLKTNPKIAATINVMPIILRVIDILLNNVNCRYDVFLKPDIQADNKIIMVILKY
jgi:hypothetical protein